MSLRRHLPLLRAQLRLPQGNRTQALCSQKLQLIHQQLQKGQLRIHLAHLIQYRLWLLLYQVDQCLGMLPQCRSTQASMIIPSHPLAILLQLSTPTFLLMDSMTVGDEETEEEEEVGVEAETETEIGIAGTGKWIGWATTIGSTIKESTAA